jgi:hypothetical protein
MVAALAAERGIACESYIDLVPWDRQGSRALHAWCVLDRYWVVHSRQRGVISVQPLP